MLCIIFMSGHNKKTTKKKENKMAKQENKMGKCKNCSNTHDGACGKKPECDKKMCDKQ